MLTAVAERVCREPKEKMAKTKPAPRVKTTIKDRIEDLRRLGHDIVKEKNKFRCTLCMRSFGKSALIDWIRKGECEHSDSNPFVSLISSFNPTGFDPRSGLQLWTPPTFPDCSDERTGDVASSEGSRQSAGSDDSDACSESAHCRDGISETLGSSQVGWKTVGKVGEDLGTSNQIGFMDWEDLDWNSPSYVQNDNARLEREREGSRHVRFYRT